MKPILKWAGGKNKLKKLILEKILSFNNYWEPFAGSASVALEVFEIKKCDIFLSDINDDLIEFYKFVRTSYKDFISSVLDIKSKFNASFDKKEQYLELRDKFNSATGAERSTLFYFLNKTSFNGLTRYNSSGKFNVPFGQREFSVDVEGIKQFSDFLNSSRVHLSQYKYELISPQKFDFVYLDPPYHPMTETSNFTSYHSENWTNQDEISLKLFCDNLNKNQVQFVLSNNDVKFIRDLFSEYTVCNLEVRKSVGAKKETRKKSSELLIFNNNHLTN